MSFRHRMTSAIVFLTVSFASFGAAQTTGLRYQGQLNDSGTAANGTFQFQFKLYDALSGGSQIGTTIPDVAQLVTNGIFSTTLDFGSGVFTGADRFLEIGVRRNAGDPYVLLNPRQKIASSPYSIRTLSAAQADVALDSLKLGGVNASDYVTTSTVGSAFVKNDTVQQSASFNISGNGRIAGSLGVGTPVAGTRLDVASGSADAVRGVSTGNGRGVWGESNSWQGVFGKSISNAGVVGESSSQYGVFGVTSGVAASGVYGSNTAVGGTAIIGQSNGGKGVFGSSSTTGGGTGVWGEVDTGGSFGVRGLGLAFNTTGVKGEANMGQGIGVWGQSDVNTGVYGLTNTGTGVYGRSTATNGLGRAFYAEGNAGQQIDKGGFVKAMLFVKANGVIDRCYNGVTNVSLAGGGTTPTGCGFTVTGPTGSIASYSITFDFSISGRYFSYTPFGATKTKAGQVFGYNANTLTVGATFVDQAGNEGVVSDFFLIVY